MSANIHSIYTDASYDNQKNYGYIGVLLIEDRSLSLPEYSSKIKIRSIENSTCSRLELEAILWAFELLDNHPLEKGIKLYTDCKTAVDLPKRREKLERNSFIAKKSGKPLNNADLYKKLYLVFDKYQPELIFIEGHKPKKEKTINDEIFSLVDKATRKSLRDLG